MALISSAEHYGAVLNLNFDYRSYLETLSADGMNYTRIFTGTYFEIEGESFGIQNNTLAPEKDKIITPWAMVVSDLSGEVKYDFSTWNEVYFERLRDFMAVAADHEIIVEEENNLAQKHLIAQNYTNFKAPIPVVSNHISVINFHYTSHWRNLDPVGQI